MAASKHLEKFTKSQLLTGETVIASQRAYRKDTAFEGLAILTDRRLCFFRAGALSDKFEPFPLSRISSVEARKGLLVFEMKVHTSGDEISLTLMEGADAGADFVRKVQEAMLGEAPATPAPGPAPSGEDPIAQLEKLGGLRAAGVISDEEFAAKKAELLARI